ncbi:uncharacterized protein LOC126976541 [Leptidea sinapis]|uniref:Regulatory protein zeste n=1 Tax=Leptidea sinapis TaxID=189913 RepID=A0A5E4PRK8_9NEOP|nr:uncharacterized protein LOC126976541 [Leptidea sinapis]VVC87711.1 unnamed protein product [Leptidea sinapis]
MNSALSRSRVSPEQLDTLLSFMEEHPDFAANKQSVYSRFSSSKLWRLLAERLNAVAADTCGARKSPDKWCRYWADIKYKARKKYASVGDPAELSSVEERLQNIINHKSSERSGTSGAGAGSSGCVSDDADDRRPADEDDMASEGSGHGEPRLSTEELLAEAAMRTALAAEKQAEAVVQAVDLLRELVAAMRERAPPPQPPPQPPPHLAPHDHALAMHHHHRL